VIEDIFLTYVNTSLEEKPEIFGEILEQFLEIDIPYRNHNFDQNLPYYFKILSKYPDYKSTLDNLDHLTNHIFGDIMVVAAFHAIYGYESGQCELRGTGSKRRCRYRRTCLVEKDPDRSSIRQGALKCYECDQLFFKMLLEKFVDINNPKKPLKLFFLMNMAYYKLRIPMPNYYPYRGLIEDPFKQYNISKIQPLRESIRFEEVFSDLFLETIVPYSLSQFMLKNDYRKLKQCPICGNFFIAKDTKRKNHCYSEQCKRAYARLKKKDQRAKDPVKYC
jgi:hypothetical protein